MVVEFFGYYNSDVEIIIDGNDKVVVIVIFNSLFIVVNVICEIIGKGWDDLVFR